METYRAKAQNEVFSADMTVDTATNVYTAGSIASCKSCQCNCHLCRGHRNPDALDKVSEIEAEDSLVQLLAA